MDDLFTTDAESNQEEIDFNLYTDYVYINGRTVTLTMIEEYIEGFRDEIENASNTIKFETFTDETLAEGGFRVTNLLSAVGANLTRGYAILRSVKAYRNKLLREWDNVKNRELSEKKDQPKTKDLREAALANKYKMIYTSVQLMNNFIDNELIEYVNEMTVAKDILSRQIASLELELKLSGIQ